MGRDFFPPSESLESEQIALVRLQMGSMDEVQKLVGGVLHDQAASPPDVLWHYTNAAGFLGICRSGKLWATNTNYLNDVSEIRFARTLVSRGIHDSHTSATDSEEREMLALVHDSIGSNATRPIFVTSFSAEKNELSQWRAYGGSTGSFALGFNTVNVLAAIAKNTTTRFHLHKYIYEEAQSLSLCQQFVDCLLLEHRSLRGKRTSGRLDYNETLGFVHEAVRVFDTLAPLMKHPDFYKEAEWRLVSDPVDLTKRPIRLREGRTRIVPYLELTISKDHTDPKFTVHTLVGPSINYNPDDVPLAQIGYCDDFMLQPFPVEASRTPYRHV